MQNLLSYFFIILILILWCCFHFMSLYDRVKHRAITNSGTKHVIANFSLLCAIPLSTAILLLASYPHAIDLFKTIFYGTEIYIKAFINNIFTSLELYIINYLPVEILPIVVSFVVSATIVQVINNRATQRQAHDCDNADITVKLPSISVSRGCTGKFNYTLYLKLSKFIS